MENGYLQNPVPVEAIAGVTSGSPCLCLSPVPHYYRDPSQKSHLQILGWVHCMDKVDLFLPPQDPSREVGPAASGSVAAVGRMECRAEWDH